jgi:hypothetical protein
MKNDPLKKFEDVTRGLHDGMGKITQPVLKRYPLLFAFLITFSAASIIRGFEVFTEQIEIFEKHPTLLILIGAVSLALTGSLYKALEKLE